MVIDLGQYKPSQETEQLLAQLGMNILRREVPAVKPDFFGFFQEETPNLNITLYALTVPIVPISSEEEISKHTIPSDASIVVTESPSCISVTYNNFNILSIMRKPLPWFSDSSASEQLEFTLNKPNLMQALARNRRLQPEDQQERRHASICSIS